MSIYINTGRLGSGKTLLAVKRIRDALSKGRRVATNLDLKLENMLPADLRDVDCIRLPDKPCVADLDLLGVGCGTLDESQYGLIVLDELGAWLNSREWADKGRQAVIDWLIHSRKKRWDVIFIVQHANMIDKQIRDALLEYHVFCKRLDKVKIPFFGAIGRVLTCGLWSGRIGKVHMGVVVDVANSTPTSPTVVDRWIYRGRDLYAAYDTEQIFTSAEASPWSYLTPWHLKGRYLAKERTLRDRVLDWWNCSRVRPFPAPVPRLRPLMGLPPDLRWLAARNLVARGVL